MTRTFRIGVIGLGLVATEHLAAYAKLDNVTIASVCDVRDAVAADWGARLSAEAFTDYRALLAKGGIDLVLVLTPASSHRPIVEAAAAAGIHILCEKPLAVTLEDGEAMVAACTRHGVKLFYGSIYRYLPAVRTAYGLIREGAIGDIQLMSEQMIGGNGAARYRQLDPSHYPDGGPGGAGMGLVDHGIHLIDVFSWYAGAAPIHVSGSGQISGKPLQSEYLVMTFPSGVMGHLLYNAGTYTAALPNEGMFSGGMSWLTDGSLAPAGTWLGEPGSIAIYGTTGTLRIFHFANALFLNTGNGPRQIPLEGRPCPDHFATQLEDCLDAIAHDRAPAIGGEDALHALRTLGAAYA
ncbi:Gfo/Idh/MocA family protein [Sphingomonas alpina]|uniref:Gfo/Idh/MocA family oxidoreductase n=1 Tax=Sphingomonas alpina TaxID=653931 RepID=A0A7H0LMB7_9SPHN|nr:Gfo/Idh/MocA family oxidoreductase [Sphingomonas alpina]QNQ10820.1 Gfo/Idh/MocA family oxidoreductase [Sphingomonas alpina]